MDVNEENTRFPPASVAFSANPAPFRPLIVFSIPICVSCTPVGGEPLNAAALLLRNALVRLTVPRHRW